MTGVRYPLLGLAAIGVIAALALGTVGSFTHAFTPAVNALVRTDRSGLLMDPGADVTLRGIVVGQVRAVEPYGDQAQLRIALDPDQARRIPENVDASITAPTVFGAKYVQLDVPRRPDPRPIIDGTIIDTRSVSTETNSVLAGLFTLLSHVDVAQLNSGLGAFSTALNGRGKQLGDLLVQLHVFLTDFNPSLPALSHDIGQTAKVANTYADAAPDLAATLGNLSVTSSTLVADHAALTSLLTDLVTVANNSRTLLRDNRAELTDTLGTLRPTSAFLAHFAPMFPCLFATSNELRRDITPAIGGQFPGIHTFTSFEPGIRGYRDPTDLPKTDDSVRPSCFGGPIAQRPGDAPYPHVLFDDGSSSFTQSNTDQLSVLPQPLPVLLFGNAARGLGR